LHGFTAMKTSKEKCIIGRREYIDFPELGLNAIIAKMDTGAYTSALYCHDIREENGVLIFRVLDPSYSNYDPREHRFTVYGEKDIKNSFGEIETRFTIKTIVKIGRRRIKSVISLTDRSDMRYPILIGRKMLNNRFIIDVSLVNTLHPNRQES
jgi:hypothetical protein